MFDTLGPLTDSVGDAAALLAALAPAQDERRPGWSARLAALAHGAGAAIAGRRIGVIANLGVDLHPETARVFRASAEALEAAGAVVEAVTLPRTVRALSEPCNEILSIEAYRLYGRLAEAEPCLLGAPVARRVLSGRDIPAHRLMAILAWREAWKQEMALLFDRLDAIVTPTTPFPAPTLEEHDEESSPASFTRFVNFLDLAAPRKAQLDFLESMQRAHYIEGRDLTDVATLLQLAQAAGLEPPRVCRHHAKPGARQGHQRLDRRPRAR